MAISTDPAANLRRSVYLILTAVAVAIAIAKIVGAEALYEPSRYSAPAPDSYSAYPPDPPRKWPSVRPEPTPMFSSNDKSRWATVKSLVEDGTFVIGQRVIPHPTDSKQKYEDQGIIRKGGGYDTVDKVLNPDTLEFTSSKPPLLSVLVAGEYWVLKKCLGWSIDADRWLVVPTILLTVNVIPFAIYLLLLARLIECTGKTDFGRILSFAAACFGTFLMTFSFTLNNHLPAAFAVLFAVYPLLSAMAENRDMGPLGYLVTGFFAALSFTLELPAASFLVGLAIPLLIARPRSTLLFFLPAALIPLAAALAANHAATGEWLPTYEKFGGPWYNYEGSHWAKAGTPNAKGIDFADESKDVYAFHFLLGHHGWFSLTPIWTLALLGLLGASLHAAGDLKQLVKSKGCPITPSLFAALTLVVSVVVIAFYIRETNNYGGFTSGPRWLFWLTPLWLLALPRAVDRLAPSRFGRGLAATLLALSVIAVFYPAANPWRPPLILQAMEFTGWLRY